MRSKNQLYGLFAQLKCCFFLIGSEGKYVVIVTCISGDPFPHIKSTQQQHLMCNMFIFWRDLGSTDQSRKSTTFKSLIPITKKCMVLFSAVHILQELLRGHETTDTTPLPNNNNKNYDHTWPQQCVYIYIWSPLMPIVQVPIFSSKIKVTLVNEAHFLSLTIVL